MKQIKLKGIKNNKHLWPIKKVFMLFLYFVPSISIQAQLVPDVATIEAYIRDHKRQRAILYARSVLEESNKLLHKASAATNRNYKEINVELDKYERAFDVLDLVLSSVQTGFGVYKTCETVNDKLKKYKDLIKEYKEKVLLRGKIESADTLLLTVNARAISSISTEVDDTWQNFLVIAGYTSGKVNCTTATLIFIVESIDNSLRKIRNIVNNAYFRTWEFIQVRTSYWKSALFRSKTIKQIADDAIGKWMENANMIGY